MPIVRSFSPALTRPAGGGWGDHSIMRILRQEEKFSQATVAERIRSARMHLGLKGEDFGRKVGIKKAHVSHIETGKSVPSELLLMSLERAFGISKRWVETGEGEMFVPRREPTIEFVTLDRPVTDRIVRDLRAYYPVPIVSGRVAAGPGASVQEDEIEDFVPSPWHAEWCPHPTQTVCVRVWGDSMEPVIPDGGLVAIDLAQRDPRRLVGLIAAVRTPDGDATIKRLMRDEPARKWIGRPENPQSPAVFTWMDVEIDAAVIGKVVWWWGKQG